MKANAESHIFNSVNKTQMAGLLDRLSQIDLTSSHYMMVLAGPNQALKNEFLKNISALLGDFSEIDLRSIISIDEEESKRKTDSFFKAISKSERNILLRNGDVLAGEYTGFTYSNVRYATPQEKYLLKRIKGSEKFFILDLKETENIDMTLRRFAQSAILFTAPTSLLGRLFWALKSIRLNGHTFINKRKSVQLV
ncbi:MAG: hypothetical protein EA360_00705 [Balneolaceae bacterium]|nr:MAG: hypothetical protein EA360_00705 [Balneolaceae bacterium]